MSAFPLLCALLQEAPVQPAGEQPAPGLFGGSMMLPLLLVLLIFWVVMIAPERKARRKRESMLGALKKGDKVMMTSGLYGAVAQVRDDVVTLQVADNVRLRFSRSAVQDVVQASEAESEEEEEPAKAAQ